MALVDEQYARVMRHLEADLPTVASQIGRESRSGRVVTEKQLRQEGYYDDRASRLSEIHLPPLGKTDVAVVPYTGEERLELVRDALITLAMTMDSSRRELARLTQEFDLESRVTFSDDEGDGVDLDLDGEIQRSGYALSVVRSLLDDDFGQGSAK